MSISAAVLRQQETALWVNVPEHGYIKLRKRGYSCCVICDVHLMRDGYSVHKTMQRADGETKRMTTRWDDNSTSYNMFSQHVVCRQFVHATKNPLFCFVFHMKARRTEGTLNQKFLVAFIIRRSARTAQWY